MGFRYFNQNDDGVNANWFGKFASGNRYLQVRGGFVLLTSITMRIDSVASRKELRADCEVELIGVHSTRFPGNDRPFAIFENTVSPIRCKVKFHEYAKVCHGEASPDSLGWEFLDEFKDRLFSVDDELDRLKKTWEEEWRQEKLQDGSFEDDFEAE